MATCRSTTPQPGVPGVSIRCTRERGHEGRHHLRVDGLTLKSWK